MFMHHLTNYNVSIATVLRLLVMTVIYKVS